MVGYLKFLFSPFGRVSRKDIWLVYLFPAFTVLFIAMMLDTDLFIAQMVLLFFAWPSFAVSAKRFHDRGMSGWWALGIVFSAFLAMCFYVWGIASSVDLSAEVFLTVLGIIVFAPITFTFVVNYCLPGQHGPNKYGPDPLDPLGAPEDAFD